MGKLLLLAGLAYVVWSSIRGRSLRSALWPLAWCAVGYVVLRYGVASRGGLRLFVGVAFLLLPWVVAPLVPRIRDRYRERMRARRAAQEATRAGSAASTRSSRGPEGAG